MGSIVVNPFTSDVYLSIVHYNSRYQDVWIRPMTRVITKSSKKRTRENLQFRKGLYKKQKRQDWDHSAYLIILQLPNEEGDMHII